jgi:hypothetical protein
MNTKGPTTQAHERHMANLKGMRKTDERRDYIAEVKRAEGPFAAKWLTDDFAHWWAFEKNKEQGK